jgi:hypothetical protein
MGGHGKHISFLFLFSGKTGDIGRKIIRKRGEEKEKNEKKKEKI